MNGAIHESLSRVLTEEGDKILEVMEPKKSAWLIALGDDGNLLWKRRLGHVGVSAAHAAALPGGGLVVAGSTWLVYESRTTDAGDESLGEEEFEFDAWLMRLDRDGKTVWKRDLGPVRVNSLEVAGLPEGGFIVAGSTSSRGVGMVHAWVAALDADGNRLWERAFRRGEESWAKDVAALPGGGFVVAGTKLSKGAAREAWVLRFDAEGNLLWDRTFGGSGTDEASSVAALPGGGLVLVGYTNSKGAGEFDAWILKLQ